MKKFLSILLAAMLVLGMVATANAEDITTITGPKNGHTYDVYQVFTADYSAEGKVLSNVKWGANCASGNTLGSDVADTVLTDLAQLSGKSNVEKRNAVLNLVDLTGTPVATLTDDQNTANVSTGYYVIVDRKDTVPAGESYTLALVQIAGAVTISPKAEVPSFEKKIKDTNDTTGDDSGWQDSADYDIGDDVPFKLTGKVAADYDHYTVYQFKFHDTLEADKFELNSDSVVVKIDEAVVTEGFTVSNSGQNQFTVAFADLKDTAAKANSVITVEYTAKLTESATIGAQGNMNGAYLEFSNNPNNEQGGETGSTPVDNVIAFTYKVVVNKVDGNGKALTGAEFTLSKKLKDGTWTPLTTVKNDAGTVFTFNGLDDGEYKLEETTTPAGMNTIESPVFFTVTGTHNATVDNLDETNRGTVLTNLTGNTTTGTVGTYTFTYTHADGTLSTNVVNLSGATLPETGGIGTTIFYLLGSIMFIGAAMTLVVRRRADAEEV